MMLVTRQAGQALLGALLAAQAEAPGRMSIVTPVELHARLSSVSVLDARKPKAFRAGHVPGSQLFDWEKWTQEQPGALNFLLGHPERWGQLPPADVSLRNRLRALGLANDRPVVVVGDPRGWGEEGRVAWNLLYWGAAEVALLNGGFPAWAADPARPVGMGQPRAVAPGAFVVRPRPARRIERESLLEALRRGGRTLLDARTPEEFAGRREHGQKRGGHIPGARLVPFRALYGPDGRYVGAETLRGLAAIEGAEPLVTYCTGGVRSALLAVLIEARLGVIAANYDGSLWEWSADPALPLESGAR